MVKRPECNRLQEVRQTYEKIIDPLLAAIRRELSAIIAKVHKVDLSKAPDPSAGLGGASVYMKDLVEKLTFIKTEVLAKFNIGETSREWCVTGYWLLRWLLTALLSTISITLLALTCPI